jgi:hypothetical protein
VLGKQEDDSPCQIEAVGADVVDMIVLEIRSREVDEEFIRRRHESRLYRFVKVLHGVPKPILLSKSDKFVLSNNVLNKLFESFIEH